MDEQGIGDKEQVEGNGEQVGGSVASHFPFPGPNSIFPTLMKGRRDRLSQLFPAPRSLSASWMKVRPDWLSRLFPVPCSLFPILRWLSDALATRCRMRVRTKLLFALLIIVVSYTTKTLQAVDLEPVMYTVDQPFSGLTDLYDARAVSIVRGEGLLGPRSVKPWDTMWLAQAPGYSIYLSAIYSTLGRDFFKVQLVQNGANSFSAVLIFLLAGSLLSWRVGVVSGLVAAVSHHMSYISNFILPDSLCALPLLAAVYILVLTRRGRRPAYRLYALAGALLGLSAWLRPQSMLIGPFLILTLVILSRRRAEELKLASVLALTSLLVILPITIHNRIMHGAMLPINIGVGHNLWAGIADASGDRFGAVATDDGVAKQEAILYNNPRYAGSVYSPDGIERDRDRVKKSLRIIAGHPFWYTGVMLKRMGDMLKYSAYAQLVLRSPDARSHERTADVKPHWEEIASGPSALAFADHLSWLRPPVRALQRITKETMLVFILIGAGLCFLASWRRAAFLLMVPLYYLVFQSFLHTEFRYTLPMQYFLFVFAAIVWVILGSVIAKATSGMFKRPVGQGSGG